jgi:hypothetical protein
MRELIYSTIGIALWAAFLYVLWSFYYVDLNFKNWSFEGRAGLIASFVSLFWLIPLAVYQYAIWKDNKKKIENLKKKLK